MFSRWMLVLLLVVPLAVVFSQKGTFVHAEDDIIDGEEDVNVDEDPSDLPADDAALAGGEGDEAEEGTPTTLRANPDADTHFLFTKPVGMGLDLPAGKDVQFLVGFANKGKKDLTVDMLEASFRYAMDFSYHLQNFSAIAFNRVIKPNEEATFAYSFFVSDAYSTRPYGLTANIYYKDAEGNQFVNAVFNETVSIVELDEGLDGETFFLYVLMAGVVVLLLVGAQQLFSSLKKKHGGPSNRPKVEMGTTNHSDIDYSYIPKESLPGKSPKASKQSPRQRVSKRTTGDD